MQLNLPVNLYREVYRQLYNWVKKVLLQVCISHPPIFSTKHIIYLYCLMAAPVAKAAVAANEQ